MAPPKGCTILIVNENVGGRTRLREALRVSAFGANVELCRSFSEAVVKLGTGIKVDVAFIGATQDPSTIGNFIKDIRASSAKNDTRCIVTLSSPNIDTGYIATLFHGGVQGFISEPYSSNELGGILDAIQDASSAPERVRDLRMLSFLLTSVQSRLDELTELQNQGKVQLWKLPRELSVAKDTFKNMYEQYPEAYVNLLVAKFEEAKPPKRSAGGAKRAAVKVVRHPGSVLRELIKARGLTEDRISASLKLEPGEFEGILAARVNVDERIASQLARVVGESPRHWLKLQKEYDLDQERRQKALAKHGPAVTP